MKINFDRLPLILPEEIIRELLIIYDTARQSSEWREVSSKLSDDQIRQVLHAVDERNEKRSEEKWLHSSQEEKDARVRGSQSFYWNRVHDGTFFEDEGKYTESTLEKRFSGDPLIEITKFRNAYLKSEEGKFYFFSTVDSPFSMCYPSAIHVLPNTFHSAVQYVMYQKAELFVDREMMKSILETASPREAFRLGREVKSFNRKVWQGNLGGIMRHTLREKFTQNEELRRQLFLTKGTSLVLASSEDKFWGIGLSEGDERSKSRRDWKGRNMLGELLTELRVRLMGEY